jgi:hypothetical protein
VALANGETHLHGGSYTTGYTSGGAVEFETQYQKMRVPKMTYEEVEVPIQVPKQVVVEYRDREVVREVPVIEYRDRAIVEYVDRPVVEYVDRPVVEYVDRPVVEYVEVVKEVPTVEYREVVKEVPTVEYREVVKEVPVVEYRDREVVKEVVKEVHDQSMLTQIKSKESEMADLQRELASMKVTLESVRAQKAQIEYRDRITTKEVSPHSQRCRRRERGSGVFHAATVRERREKLRLSQT